MGLVRPTGIAVTASGVVYVTDGRGLVIELTPEGGMRTVGTRRPGRAGGVSLEFRELAGLVPGSRYVEVPGAGHLPCVQEPAAVAGAILRFAGEASLA